MLSLLLALAAGLQTPASDVLLHDTRGRPMIRVRMNDQGPFDMVVDTAAQASLIVPSLAGQLHLRAKAEQVTIIGATGAEASDEYALARMQNGALDVRDMSVLLLPNAGITDARGIIGMDVFKGRKLTFDRRGGRFANDPSSAPAAGYAAHKGVMTDTGFVRVPVVIDGVTVQATIDTGAAISVANMATLRALGWEEDDPRLAKSGAILGSSARGQAVTTGVVGQLDVGPVKLSNVPVFFSGDTGDVPTILLGCDLLNLLEAYAVDLGRGELQILVPPRAAA